MLFLTSDHFEIIWNYFPRSLEFSFRCLKKKKLHWNTNLKQENKKKSKSIYIHVHFLIHFEKIWRSSFLISCLRMNNLILMLFSHIMTFEKLHKFFPFSVRIGIILISNFYYSYECRYVTNYMQFFFLPQVTFHHALFQRQTFPKSRLRYNIKMVS